MAVELFNHRQWILGSGGCKLMSGILLLNLYGSVYFLSTISVGKFQAHFLIEASVCPANIFNQRPLSTMKF